VTGATTASSVVTVTKATAATRDFPIMGR
jgi:hypothetical protein